MDVISILLLAVALAMDCMSVSIAKGISTGQPVLRHANGKLHAGPWIMALLFGIFQGGMPLITFYAGSLFAEKITEVDHWIALILLAIIGGNMLYESLKKDDETEHSTDFSIRTLLLLAIATSIDAMATGIIFVPTPHIITTAVAIIASVSFVLSIAGYMLGAAMGKHLKINIETIGGIILILIGIKIFCEHMFGGN